MRKSKERLAIQANDMNVFDEIYIMDERNLEPKFYNKFKDKMTYGSRGFGYWCWKPQVVLQVMNKMSDGDIVLYADTGCHLNPLRRAEMLELIDTARNSISGIVGFQATSLPENIWTKGDLFDYFNVRNREDITHSGQLGGGFFLVRKNSQTNQIMRQWLEIYEDNFDLANDTPSKSSNLDGFRENRHDQSILSLLFKINNATLIVDQHQVCKTEKEWTEYRFPIQIRRDRK